MIWITGYSSAGKSTVGRRVTKELRDRGYSTVFLDGDQLRAVFGSQFGYEPAQRRELAMVYMRLCSHLAAQGHVVVLSAIAMYDEVTDWMRKMVPRSVQVYLSVPRETRLQRDSKGRGVYQHASAAESTYDGPKRPDLVLANDDGCDVDALGRSIADYFEQRAPDVADIGRRDYWNGYYVRNLAPEVPSPFAQQVAKHLREGQSVLEIGCGNGRDAMFFASLGCRVMGLDPSQAAIDGCRARAAESSLSGVEFFCGGASELADASQTAFEVVYSRFVFHAMTLTEEIQTLRALRKLLQPGGKLYIECRSINDPQAVRGEIISPTERIDGHYRRFIVREELVQRVTEAGFAIDDCIESNGFAKMGDDDPVLIRMTGTRLA